MKPGILFGAALAVLLSGAAGLAAPADFVTQEYSNSTGLRAINAADAYDLGFTGKGVVVGVVDSYFAPQQGEFEGKYPYGVVLGEDTDDHGIHVAGIIAARRDGIGMHGTAFDAFLLPVADLGATVAGWTKFLGFPEVRIISNSWGTNIFPDQLEAFNDSWFGKYSTTTDYNYDDDPEYGPDAIKDWLHEKDADLAALALKLAGADRLIVFAAGNEGHLSPGVDAALPTLVKEYGTEDGQDADEQAQAARDLKLRWLSVAAFDPAHVISDGNGAWIPDGPAFPAVFTNMGLFASDYTLWAPGVDIYSTIGPQIYGKESGTSMAAPYVAGVAALTRSAFPYMGGKQIADVLLSTATKFDEDNTPAAFILNREEYSDPDPEVGLLEDRSGLRLYYDTARITTLADLTEADEDALITRIAEREGSRVKPFGPLRARDPSTFLPAVSDCGRRTKIASGGGSK
jgi:subtilase-type serine protease